MLAIRSPKSSKTAKRAIYIYYLGTGEYSVDFYHCKSGNSFMYLKIRSKCLIDRIKKIMRNTGGNYFVECEKETEKK